VDLSAYTGGERLLAFFYVTDDAIQHAGAAIDSPLLSAGTASPMGVDWISTGWSRVGQLLPQEWVVSAVELHGEQASPLRLQIDEDGRAEHQFNSETERAVVAISAATPLTLQRGSYGVRLTPRQSATPLD